jgi:hypothetical protein
MPKERPSADAGTGVCFDFCPKCGKEVGRRDCCRQCQLVVCRVLLCPDCGKPPSWKSLIPDLPLHLPILFLLVFAIVAARKRAVAQRPEVRQKEAVHDA